MDGLFPYHVCVFHEFCIDGLNDIYYIVLKLSSSDL